MGYSFEGICYATAQEAKDVYFEGVPPSFSGSVETIYQRDASGNWFLTQGTYASNGAYTLNYSVTAQTPVFAFCDSPTSPTDHYLDGVSLGWGVALAMIGAWCVTVLRRGI